MGSISHIPYPSKVSSPADLLNVVVPYLGDPLDLDSTYDGVTKVRLFGPGLIAHMSYVAMHVPIPSRDGIMEKEYIRPAAEVSDLLSKKILLVAAAC